VKDPKVVGSLPFVPFAPVRAKDWDIVISLNKDTKDVEAAVENGGLAMMSLEMRNIVTGQTEEEDRLILIDKPERVNAAEAEGL